MKKDLHAPFKLHVLAHIKPQKNVNTQYRLQLVNQLLISGDNLSAYPKAILIKLSKQTLTTQPRAAAHHTIGQQLAFSVLLVVHILVPQCRSFCTSG